MSMTESRINDIRRHRTESISDLLEDPVKIVESGYGFDEKDDPTGLSHDSKNDRVYFASDLIPSRKDDEDKSEEPEIFEPADLAMTDYGFDETDDPTGDSLGHNSPTEAPEWKILRYNKKRRTKKTKSAPDSSSVEQTESIEKNEEPEDEFTEDEWREIDKMVDSGRAGNYYMAEEIIRQRKSHAKLGSAALSGDINRPQDEDLKK